MIFNSFFIYIIVNKQTISRGRLEHFLLLKFSWAVAVEVWKVAMNQQKEEGGLSSFSVCEFSLSRAATVFVQSLQSAQ